MHTRYHVTWGGAARHSMRLAIALSALAYLVAAAPIAGAAGPDQQPNYVPCSTTLWLGLTSKPWSHMVSGITYSGTMYVYGKMDARTTSIYCGQMYGTASLKVPSGAQTGTVKADLHWKDGSNLYHDANSSVVNGIAGSTVTAQSPTVNSVCGQTFAVLHLPDGDLSPSPSTLEVCP